MLCFDEENILSNQNPQEVELKREPNDKYFNEFSKEKSICCAISNDFRRLFYYQARSNVYGGRTVEKQFSIWMYKLTSHPFPGVGRV